MNCQYFISMSGNNRSALLLPRKCIYFIILIYFVFEIQNQNLNTFIVVFIYMN